VYSVVRTESGLIRAIPPWRMAGRDTASRFGVTYDWNRLVCDRSTTLRLVQVSSPDYCGITAALFSLSSPGYNAGPGLVEKWIAQYGDPRDPNVDPIDWVERIPFAETRNYVQRVMENLQVYRARFGRGSVLVPITNISAEQSFP
jgi:peptidoglycan lytic transglycosylase